MNSVPQYLFSEDRQEYERLLDEALRSVPHRPELAALGRKLSLEQLRTMALSATSLITAAAATEYQHYVRVREEMRDPAYWSTGDALTASSFASSHSGSRPASAGRPAPAGQDRRFGGAVPGAGQSGRRRIGGGVAAQRWARMSYGRRLLAAVLGLHVRPEVPAGSAMEARKLAPESAEAGRSGAWSYFAVPAAVLSGTVTAIFFLAGIVLMSFSAESDASRSMIAAGWVAGAVCAGTLAVLLVLARRHRPPVGDWSQGEMSEKVALAKEAWREALLERGIMPFLREASADPGGVASDVVAPPEPTSRMPHLGYDRPGFPRPHSGASGPRPSFTSPDYTSPDFGGSEHQPE
ncbi:membrane protein [Streptomyces venetus]|uniref:Membrane protein n=1 Tax=Streptomyces venetus TaxID=1701086 RepID=A0ABP8GSU1_9ACTN